MVTVLDLENDGLSLRRMRQLVKRSAGVLLRRDGTVFARLEPADELDLEDEIWARAPAQLARRREARKRLAKGLGIPHEQLKQELGFAPRTRAKPKQKHR